MFSGRERVCKTPHWVETAALHAIFIW